MKRFLPVQELARDARFKRISIEDRMSDRRTAGRPPSLATDEKGDKPGEKKRRNQRLSPDLPDAPDRARSLMHGIFVGEIQALEGAGRTCWDFEVGKGSEEVPFELKLDMARQCWDESRHCEISIKLSDWMGTEIGEFAESTFLFEASCNADPILRLAGVNRGLEGLAIDVFTTMKEFGEVAQDPVLEFCEDWMLADEVTHVKMGSTWLRECTKDDPDRRARALEFQRVVDKLFSLGGLGPSELNLHARLARDVGELVELAVVEARQLAEAARQADRAVVVLTAEAPER